MKTQKVAPPSNDLRWRKVDVTMRNFGYAPDSLIEVLHTVQDLFGYLDDKAMRYVALSLRMSPSEVFGVATFYHLFTLTPPADHAVTVCTGTACHIKGSDKILEAIDRATGLRPGEVAPGGEVLLQTAACVGFCSPAPVVVFDEDSVGNLTPNTVVEQIRRWMTHAA